MGGIIERFAHNDNNEYTYNHIDDIYDEDKSHGKECSDSVRKAFDKLLDILDIKYTYKNNMYYISDGIDNKDQRSKVFWYYAKSCCGGLIKMNKIISRYDPAFDMSKYLGTEDTLSTKLLKVDTILFLHSIYHIVSGHTNFCIIKRSEDTLNLYRYEPGGLNRRNDNFIKKKYKKIMSKYDIDDVSNINQRRYGLQSVIPRGLCTFFSLLVGTISMIILSSVWKEANMVDFLRCIETYYLQSIPTDRLISITYLIAYKMMELMKTV